MTRPVICLLAGLLLLVAAGPAPAWWQHFTDPHPPDNLQLEIALPGSYSGDFELPPDIASLRIPYMSGVDIKYPGKKSIPMEDILKKEREAYERDLKPQIKKLEARTGRPVRSWQVLHR